MDMSEPTNHFREQKEHFGERIRKHNIIIDPTIEKAQKKIYKYDQQPHARHRKSLEHMRHIQEALDLKKQAVRIHKDDPIRNWKLYRSIKIVNQKTKRLNQLLICNLCSYQQRRLSSMKDHVRVHTGEEPFPCNYCPQKFSSKSHRNRHEDSMVCI